MSVLGLVSSTHEQPAELWTVVWRATVSPCDPRSSSPGTNPAQGLEVFRRNAGIATEKSLFFQHGGVPAGLSVRKELVIIYPTRVSLRDLDRN